MDTEMQRSYFSNARNAAWHTRRSNARLHKCAWLKMCRLSRLALPVQPDGCIRWKPGQENQGCAPRSPGTAAPRDAWKGATTL